MNPLRTGGLLMVISGKTLTISFMKTWTPARRKKRGAEYSGNWSTIRRFSPPADCAPKMLHLKAFRTTSVHQIVQNTQCASDVSIEVAKARGQPQKGAL